MSSLDSIKKGVKALYDSNPNIHVSVTSSHPRINIKNDPAVITDVYPNVFRIEECSSGVPKSHTLQYKDILTKQIEIAELDN